MAHYISNATGNLTKIAGNDYKAYMPLGMIFASAAMLDEYAVKRLDGQSLGIDGVYTDFCNWIINKGTHVPTCNIATYATEMTTYGQCGKFVINNTDSTQTSGTYTVPAHSIKLPTITEFVASNNGGDVIGLAELDMFTEHTHAFMSAGKGGSYTDNYKQLWTATGGSDGNGVPANLTLPTFQGTQGVQNTGGSETRPKNIRYPYYIVVAQGVKSIALADMEQKANKDASNLSNANIENWQNKCRFERVETIYDKSSTNPNINLGYTSGIKNLQVVSIDLSKYKKINVFLNLYDSQISNGGNRNDIMQLDLKTNRLNDSNYASNTFGYIYLDDNVGWQVNNNELFMARVDYNHKTKVFVPKLAYNGNLVNSDTYYIYKIEGVY